MYKELKISIPAPPEDYQSWKSRLEQVQGSENMYITLRSQLQAQLAVAEGKRINKALVFMNIKPQSVESIKRALRELDKGHEENVRLLKHGRYFLDAEEFVHQLEQFPLDDGSSTDETSVTSS